MAVKLPVIVGGGLLLGICAGLLLVPGALERITPRPAVNVIGEATVGGAFTMTDHTGRRVSDQDWRGRYMLVFFGFTFCPDVCPTALQVSTAALEKLGAKADRIGPVFISVDPERDTPQALASYLASFDKRFVGLTGTSEEVASVAKAYRVFYRKVKDEKSTAGYTIDHTAIVYLMDPAGRFVTHFTHATSPDTMAASLAKHVK